MSEDDLTGNIQEWDVKDITGASVYPHPVGNDRDMGDWRLLERIPVLNSKYFTIDVIQWLLLIQIWKKDPEMFERLWEHREEALTKMVTSLAQAGAGNGAIAMGATHIIAQLLEHAYYIRKGGAASIQDSMSKITAIDSIAAAASLVFTGAGSFTKGLKGIK